MEARADVARFVTRRHVAITLGTALLLSMVYSDAAAAVDGGAGASQPAPWERTAQEVRARLGADEALQTDRIEVAASGLVLTLTGTVHSRAEADRAVQIARSQAAAHMIVSDELRIEAPVAGQEEAARTLAKRLGASMGSVVVVNVAGDTATLEGVVDSEMARQRALLVARQSPGISRVVDRLEVRRLPAGGKQ